MQPGYLPDEERDMVAGIKERIEGGQYSVDPRAVAEAMLARGGTADLLRALWSEVLVAAQSTGSTDRDSLSGLDAS